MAAVVADGAVGEVSAGSAVVMGGGGCDGVGDGGRWQWYSC